MNTTHQPARRNRRKGFTFIELMLVVVIIGVLAAVAVPRLTGRTRKARQAAARMGIQNISTALEAFELDTGRFPSTEDGLAALIERPSWMVQEAEWNGPYLKELPRDPWKRSFIYKCPGERGIDFDLLSPGADGEEGTEDDIGNFSNEQ